MRLLDAVDVYVDEGSGAAVLVGSLRACFVGGRTLASSSFEYAPSHHLEALEATALDIVEQDAASIPSPGARRNRFWP